jgi:hypothetical protein
LGDAPRFPYRIECLVTVLGEYRKMFQGVSR